MRSMTGFGKGAAAHGGHRVEAELKTVNHRYLDFSMRLPAFFAAHEAGIRRQISERLSRGRVDVLITYQPASDGSAARLNVPLAAAYVRAAAEAAALGVADDLTTSTLLAMPDILLPEAPDPDGSMLPDLIREAVGAALDALVEAREQEGRRLEADIRPRLGTLCALAERIGSRRDVVVDDYRRRLTERIESLLGSAAVDTGRLAQETALFADRCDVTEEVVRIISHAEQFAQRCASQGPVGKSLDFLAQELNREFNTIGSKSQDGVITAAAIDGKAEVEKIREQIQNIE